MKEFYAMFSWRKRLLLAFTQAKLHRLSLTQTQFIGITGSAGKTTTKELCNLILSGSYSVMTTPQSLNTPIIVAETMLATEKKHKFCIMELGAFKPGALDLPLRLFRPKIGVLTNIEKDHYRAFKGQGVDGIAVEKAKLIEALSKNGTAILNMDDPRVKAIGERCKARVIWVGKNPESTIRLCKVTSRWPEPLKLTVTYQGKLYEVPTHLYGTQLALSILSALGVAIAAGLSIEEAINKLVEAVPTAGRMQIVTGEDDVTFIRDDMKAPYWSLLAPFKFLKEADALRKIAVVGSISDFSGDSTMIYKRCARELREYADMVIFVGDNAHRALRARKDENDSTLQGFLTLKEASSFLQKTLRPGDLVLLKGSNKSDHLQRLILDRYKPIQCWQERCGLEHFCNHCSQLYRGDSTNEQTGNLVDKVEIPVSIPVKETGRMAPVIVGLGNPGKEFENTLHNIGYSVLDKLAVDYGGIWQNEEEGQTAWIILNGVSVVLFKSDAYMNKTGLRLKHYLARTGRLPEHCLLIYDDMDIEFGTIKFKPDGGDGGHLGLRSCLKSLRIYTLPRLRCGVRSPGNTAKAKEQVLAKFNKKELEQLPQILDQAVDMVIKTIPQLQPESLSELPAA
ncbi:aminoacyl-tRNA hydrolase [Nitrosomonas eutropha]|uniref:aminoacyl-tRNA hydrolase n=1 Tax=Nitrosomonas eutropha TaxID=916 RepID=UPI001F5D3B9B|nr:aminoacyl-tRNA hydrolase [Nitrosomonas eutropha]